MMRIGVLGGGQLGRMLAEAGHPMGMEFDFLDPKPDACAAKRGRLIVGDWDDDQALARLGGCDRITFDFENVPERVLRRLARKSLVRPGPEALAAAQDRAAEKQLFESLDIPVAAWATVDSRPDLLAAVERTGLPAVLKTRRMGYDGKGQEVLRDKEDLETAWQRIGGHPLVLEAFVPFEFECAMSAVRSSTGDIRYYPLTRTLHENGILSLARGPLPNHEGSLGEQARAMLDRLASHLDYTGVLTLEFFVRNGALLANEMAPRVHNSAHWTIEGTECSQFENHLRAVADLPLGSTRAWSESVMINWIGEVPDPADYLDVPGLSWHDYGKKPRLGRKVGHATLVAPDRDGLEARLQQLQKCLPGALAGRIPRLLEPGQS